jgi:hypothetical protein
MIATSVVRRVRVGFVRALFPHFADLMVMAACDLFAGFAPA